MELIVIRWRSPVFNHHSTKKTFHVKHKLNNKHKKEEAFNIAGFFYVLFLLE